MAAENKAPISKDPHVCLHETDLITMSTNIEKICKQMDAVHTELLGKVGDAKQVGMKGKVESLRKQLILIYGILSVLGTGIMAGVAKILFFHGP